MTRSTWSIEPSHHREHHADERDTDERDADAINDIADAIADESQREDSAMAEALRESAEGFDAVEANHGEPSPEL